MSLSIDRLYHEPWAHRATPHPLSGRPVRLMTPREIVRTAAKLLSVVERTSLRQVVVLESGAAPLGAVCRLLAEKRGLTLGWHGLKLDRAAEGFHSSSLPPIGEQFLLMDEYVDSGATVKRALKTLNRRGRAGGGIVCYGWLNQDPELEPWLVYACVDGRQGCWWEAGGAYPYENRIDLIGSYYRGGDPAAGPCRVSDFLQPLSPRAVIGLNRFLLKAAARCSAGHALRLCLAVLEASAGTAAGAELLLQLADMYGPMWSPYPDRLHLEFMRAAAAAKKRFRELKGRDLLLKDYLAVREPLLHAVALICESRRLTHRTQILRAIEEAS